MTPSEVIYKTAEKITQHLASPIHKDLTAFGNEQLEAFQKLADIMLPGKKLTPHMEAEAPRVKVTNPKVEVANPRVKAEIPRVGKLPKKTTTLSTKTPNQR